MTDEIGVSGVGNGHDSSFNAQKSVQEGEKRLTKQQYDKISKSGVTDGRANSGDASIFSQLNDVVKFFHIKEVPSYGNNFFFTIGVYLLGIFAILVVTGMLLLLFGPTWGNTPGIGNFVLSVHLWAAMAFVTLIFVHLFVNFSTSMFKHRKLVWMIGSIMLMIVLLEFAFGASLPGSFLAQVNARAGADLWNGMGLGFWINPLNSGAVLGWHVAIIPLLLVGLIFTHYMLVKRHGMSKPYRDDIVYGIVPVDHDVMVKRMIYVTAIILLFAIFLRAPGNSESPPMTTQSFAISTPNGFAMTLMAEFNYTSETATYLDTIDPYTFSTRNVYVETPYLEYINTTHDVNELDVFNAETPYGQNASMTNASAYFAANGTLSGAINSSDPLTSVIGTLTNIAQKGLYGPILQSETASGINQTYTLLFLSDSQAFNNLTTASGLQDSEWGMLKLGNAWWQTGIQYWLAPYNFMEIVTAGIPWWNDLENGTVAGVAFILLLFLPYIPGLRDIPDRLKLYKLFWNKHTIPELKGKKKG